MNGGGGSLVAAVVVKVEGEEGEAMLRALVIADDVEQDLDLN